MNLFSALLRGEKQKALSIKWDFTGPGWNRKDWATKDALVYLLGKNVLHEKLLMTEILDLSTKKLSSSEMRRIKTARRKAAVEDSCSVFGRNLKALLLQGLGY